MSNTKKMLNEAIESFGLNDIVTIMLSQKLDNEIIRQQKKERL